MRNIINTKKRTWMNTVGYQLAQAAACWFIFLLLMLLWLSKVGDAEGAEMELSAGRSNYTTSENGTWWQEGREHHIENHANSYAIGLTDYLAESIRWRVGYANLGQQSVWAIATSDPDYNGSGCIANPCAQNAVVITKGHVEGIYFTIAPEYQYKDVKLFVEAGLWAYQARFNVVIIDQVPTNKVIIEWTKNNDTQVNWVVGAGVEYKNTQVVLSAWRVDSTGEQIDTQPSYRGFTTNVSIRHHF